MRRRFSFATFLLLLLCAAIAGLWAWSFQRTAQVAFVHHREHCRACIAAGRAGVDNGPEVAIESAKREQDLKAIRSIEGGLDLVVEPPSRVPRRWSRSSALFLPALAACLVALIVLPLPIRWAVHRRRIACGHCRSCGYDLKGNASGVCPECAMSVA